MDCDEYECFSLCGAENVVKKVEDIMPIATGHEREELEAELQVSFLPCFTNLTFFG